MRRVALPSQEAAKLFSAFLLLSRVMSEGCSRRGVSEVVNESQPWALPQPLLCGVARAQTWTGNVEKKVTWLLAHQSKPDHALIAARPQRPGLVYVDASHSNPDVFVDYEHFY